MTTPTERTNAVLMTEQFLYELTRPKATPGVPKRIREIAFRCLRHYPNSFDMETAAMLEGSKSVQNPFGESYNKWKTKF